MKPSAIETSALRCIHECDGMGIRPADLRAHMLRDCTEELSDDAIFCVQERGFAVLKNGRLWLTAIGQQAIAER